MTLTEALRGSRLAGAEPIAVLIHRSHQGYHLTRYMPGEAGRSPSQRWVLPTFYDLLVFARAQGTALVEATDWRAPSCLA